MESSAEVFLGLHDFLERMRQPSATDLVKSIKSFIVSYSNNAPDPERDRALVQGFLANMESSFRAHPLWAGSSEEELDSAGEGLEKYVMTKLFPRVFASAPDDVKADEQLSEKMALVQQFIRPENLDMKPALQNETSWLLAQKELQKINMYKAPRDKLICILSCCKVISDLLRTNEHPDGADEFLSVLIYVTIKANPPQLHSNLMYIQRYRGQSRLVGEAAYFLTNMLSAASFISNIDSKSLSMEESEFEKHMEFSRALLSGLSSDVDSLSNQILRQSGNNSKEVKKAKDQILNPKKVKKPSDGVKSLETRTMGKNLQHAEQMSKMSKIPALSDIENRGGAAMLLREDQTSKVIREYPYLFAHVGDLTASDIEDLLNSYKQLVVKYVSLSKGLGDDSTCAPLPLEDARANNEAAIPKEHVVAEAALLQDAPQKHAGLTPDSRAVSLASEENNSPEDEVAVPLENVEDTEV